MLNKDLIRNAKEEIKWLSSTLLFGGLNGVLVIWQAWVISSLISEVFMNGKSMLEVRDSMITLLILIIFRLFFLWAGEYSGAVTSIKIKNKLRNKITDKVISSGNSIDPKQQTGELSAVMIEGIEKLDGYFMKYLPHHPSIVLQ